MAAFMIAMFTLGLAINMGEANGDSCVEFAAGGPGTCVGGTLIKVLLVLRDRNSGGDSPWGGLGPRSYQACHQPFCGGEA